MGTARSPWIHKAVMSQFRRSPRRESACSGAQRLTMSEVRRISQAPSLRCVGASRGNPSDMSVLNSPPRDPPFEKREEKKPSRRSKSARWGAVLAVAGIFAYGFCHSSFRPHDIRSSTDKVPPLSPTPKTMPTPDPFDQEWAEVNQFSSTGDWQSAVTACVDLVERYPSRDETRRKLTTLLEEAQNNPNRINDENFSL